MLFYFLFRNQINNSVLSQEHKFGKDQGLKKIKNWKVGVFTVLFKFSLVAKKNWKLVIADGTKYLVKIM